MGRTDSLAKLAWAYGKHLARRRVSKPTAQVSALLETYRPDGMIPLTIAERERHPKLIGCINCGMCALAASRLGAARLPDLASSYLRLYAYVDEAGADLSGDMPDLAAASAVCPVGVPLEEVAALVRRFTDG
jgi:hypothetical protein